MTRIIRTNLCPRDRGELTARMALISIAALILCSCRSADRVADVAPLPGKPNAVASQGKDASSQGTPNTVASRSDTSTSEEPSQRAKPKSAPQFDYYGESQDSTEVSLGETPISFGDSRRRPDAESSAAQNEHSGPQSHSDSSVQLAAHAQPAAPGSAANDTPPPGITSRSPAAPTPLPSSGTPTAPEPSANVEGANPPGVSPAPQGIPQEGGIPSGIAGGYAPHAMVYPGNGGQLPYPCLPAAPPGPHAALPLSAYTGQHTGCSCCPQRPAGPGRYGTWEAPGVLPVDEYLFDGGDREVRVTVAQNWNVRGLDMEDTIAHFDTRDGKTLVESTNRVPIYAPRFAAVRRVDGLVETKHRKTTGSSQHRLAVVSDNDILPASTAKQHLQLNHQLSLRGADAFQENEGTRLVDNTLQPNGVQVGQLPYAGNMLTRQEIYDNSEKPRLNDSLSVPTTATEDQTLQVVIRGNMPSEAVNGTPSEEHFKYELPPGKPRLQIIKRANRHNARPGEIVEFTILFRNGGDQLIGNVTVIDNLTPRLEYIPDSQSCSLKTEFFDLPNEGESSILRWEITDPMKVGQAGEIRFKCRVR